MKVLISLIAAPLISHAAPNPSAESSSPSSRPLSQVKQEPSATPCLPQQTPSDKLDDLATLETPTHSTNCPAEGAIKTYPGKKADSGTTPAPPVQTR